MKYELRLQLSTDVDIVKIKDIIRGLEKTGKVDVHWIRSQTVGRTGRPGELKIKVMQYLEAQDYPKSVKQIAVALETSAPHLYRVLYSMENITSVEDPKWNCKRWGTDDQVAKWNAREERRAKSSGSKDDE